MLTLQHITIKDSNNHTIINDLSFSLGQQDKVGIIGEEGNGKSTLLKTIYNLEDVNSYMSVSGRIDMDFKQIGYLSQSFDPIWNHETCLDYLLKQKVEEPIPLEAYNELGSIQQYCASMGIAVNFILSEQPIVTLSGGEKVKLRLLKMMRQNCDLYLLDEPTNDLDIITLQWLEGFINKLTVPVMFVSHDETLLRNCANRILHLEQRNKKNKTVITDAHYGYDTYVKERISKRAKEEQLAHKEKQEYENKKARLNDIMNAVHDAQNHISRQSPHAAKMLKRKMHSVKAMQRRVDNEAYHKLDSLEEAIDIYFEDISGISDKVILQETVTVCIQGKVLIHPYELTVRGKDKIAIIGNNGCGKTQLMKLLYQMLKERKDIKVGYMPQNYYDLMKQDMLAYEFLLEQSDQEDITRCREYMGSMKFTKEEMVRPIHSLSEGQKAKLFLLKFIKTKCNVLLLDEPTRNLSPLSAPAIRKQLKEYEGCILAVTHDRVLLSEVFPNILQVENCLLTPIHDLQDQNRSNHK